MHLQLVKNLSWPGSNGWVPWHVVLQEMEKDSRFGFARGEHEYWLEQSIHRLNLLEVKKEQRDHRSQSLVRARQNG